MNCEQNVVILKIKRRLCRSLFSSNSFILCRLIRLHLFSHKAIRHRNAGKEKLFTHTIRYRTNIYEHIRVSRFSLPLSNWGGAGVRLPLLFQRLQQLLRYSLIRLLRITQVGKDLCEGFFVVDFHKVFVFL